ncbi:hypothetical protein BN7_2622 [Wickerhamomyces ciferrii]|uniref:AB hydrolase-1 domain-containing protein n=1 Tax=Wickerhamomyces ciferrii (strain ATCC 14091 / BCRC 22168 / CBS 111 / JCM 3599 / NBRC 0793 / NRRL Y-1031 F-60-10) TaxID=1206466 RepID=K0KD94_WICCF|nr:uncharacterized protein BN7_2622 [Wickerhamomyces ciferrii]CCH43075.1 hypothetical protein BN7_2622 [Wickerhamomyces ciferrii]
MFRYSIRPFSTSFKPLKQKTLIQKVISSEKSKNSYELGLLSSTSLFFKWALDFNPRKTLTNYQNEILESLKIDPYAKIESNIVSKLGEIKIINPKAQIKTPTLLIHGFASSGIFYHKNFTELSQRFQKLYTIDLPDIGLSQKAPLDIKSLESIVKLEPNGDKIGYQVDQDLIQISKTITSIENYYIEAIENWRQTNGLNKINLLGHSFGGFLSFKYCLRYPQHIEKLILVSPLGMERNISSIHNKSTQGIISSNPKDSNYFRSGFIPKFVMNYGFNILKWLGPLGVRLVSKYLSSRLTRSSTNSLIDSKELNNFFLIYTILLIYQKNNSFKMFKNLFNNSLLSFDPILDNLDKVKIPVMIMYGQFDWMNVQAGFEAVNELNGMNKVENDFTIIKNAGHNIFLDNPKDFNMQVINYFNEV